MTHEDPTPPTGAPDGRGAPLDPTERDIDADLEHLHDPELGDALRAVLTAGEDVRSRARASVENTLQARSITSSLTDAVGSGLATIRHLLTNPPEPADMGREDEQHRHRRADDAPTPQRGPGTGEPR